MWYFAWVLGIGLACAFGIINAMWLEAYRDYDKNWDREVDIGQTAEDHDIADETKNAERRERS